jgi:NAD(P)-dependent dehydrogenase (short-subunit alcohol dehydrogenase family)
MDLGFEGKTAVITGGGSGIGKAIALKFLEEGLRVAICGRSRERLAEAALEFEGKGHSLFYAVADVSDVKSLKAFAEQANDALGRIDIWVNNAGIEHMAPLEQMEEADFMEVLDVNLAGVWRGSKLAVPYLARHKGCIIHISSFTSLIPTARNGAYSIAKAGVNTLTKVMAAELAPKGIRANAIIPGMIVTDMTRESVNKIEDVLLAPISQGRLGEPEDIAAGALYLASERLSAYVTGHLLVLSGGKFLVQNAADPWSNYAHGY